MTQSFTLPLLPIDSPHVQYFIILIIWQLILIDKFVRKVYIAPLVLLKDDALTQIPGDTSSQDIPHKVLMLLKMLCCWRGFFITVIGSVGQYI